MKVKEFVFDKHNSTALLAIFLIENIHNLINIEVTLDGVFYNLVDINSIHYTNNDRLDICYRNNIFPFYNDEFTSDSKITIYYN